MRPALDLLWRETSPGALLLVLLVLVAVILAFPPRRIWLQAVVMGLFAALMAWRDKRQKERGR